MKKLNKKEVTTMVISKIKKQEDIKLCEKLEYFP